MLRGFLRFRRSFSRVCFRPQPRIFRPFYATSPIPNFPSEDIPEPEDEFSIFMDDAFGLPIHTYYCNLENSISNDGRLLTSQVARAPIVRLWPLALFPFLPHSATAVALTAVAYGILRIAPIDMCARFVENLKTYIPRYVSSVRVIDDKNGVFSLSTFLAGIGDADGTPTIQLSMWRTLTGRSKCTRDQMGWSVVGSSDMPKSWWRRELIVTKRDILSSELITGHALLGRFGTFPPLVKLTVSLGDVDMAHFTGPVSKSGRRLLNGGDEHENLQDSENDIDEPIDCVGYVRTFLIGCENVSEAQLLLSFFNDGEV